MRNSKLQFQYSSKQTDNINIQLENAQDIFEQITNRPRQFTVPQKIKRASNNGDRKKISNADLEIKKLLTNDLNLSQLKKKRNVRVINRNHFEDFVDQLSTRRVHLVKSKIYQKNKQRYIEELSKSISQQCFYSSFLQFDATCANQINNLLFETNIKKINLNRSPLGDEGIMKLINLFYQLELEELSLVSVCLTPRSAKALITSLSGKSSLKRLDLSSSIDNIHKNRLQIEGIKPFKIMLNHQKCYLEDLNIENASIKEQGIVYAFTGLKSSSLMTLNLGRNQIDKTILQNVIKDLSNNTIRHLDLSGNCLGDRGVQILTKSLGSSTYGQNLLSTSLYNLKLNSNGIKSIGFQILCKEMAINQGLQELNLDDNPVGEGLYFYNIKHYLIKNWTLKTLSLANTHITQNQIKFLCEGLESNRTLQNLNISRNQISFEGLHHIFCMLHKNKSLRQISMKACNISDNYIIKCQNTLKSKLNFSFEEIDFENNYIKQKGAQIFKQIALRNKNLTKIVFRKNCVSKRLVDEINEILKQNQKNWSKQIPEINYYDYVNQLYNSKANELKQQVEKIKFKQRDLKLTALLQEVKLKLVEEKSVQNQISKQNQLISHLSNRIFKKTSKIRLNSKDLDQKTFRNPSLKTIK